MAETRQARATSATPASDTTTTEGTKVTAPETKEESPRQRGVDGEQPTESQVTGAGFHDSLTGRPVNEAGTFIDTATPGSESQVPQHRIVANDWPEHEKHTKDEVKHTKDEPKG